VAAAGLFVFTFGDATAELGQAGDDVGGRVRAGIALLAVLALAGAALLGRSRRASGLYEAAMLAIVVTTSLVAVVAGGNGDVWALVFNLLFAALALGVVYAGYLNDEVWLVNLGVLLVAVDLVARYFDFFWSALPRSLGMIGAGLIVLGIAYVLERQRKRLLERMAEA
jgi:hypothetical protein